jgi:hypothetical protein
MEVSSKKLDKNYEEDLSKELEKCKVSKETKLSLEKKSDSDSDSSSSEESGRESDSSSSEDSDRESDSSSSEDSDSSSDEDSSYYKETINDPDYKLLPKILVKIKIFLKKKNIKFSKKTLDGRTNSSLDEDIIVDILKNSKFAKHIIIPKIRYWYDMIVYDKIYGKIPVNIKSTTLKNADNVGNLAIAVQSYTNYNLNLREKCDNGKASKILYEYLKKGKINTNIKKDYFFLVFNKNKPNDIYINSVLGLKKLTRNNNNLPFQVKWKDNKNYENKSITEKVEIFKKTIKGKLTWRTEFLLNMNML